jgi:glycerol-3-phosphate acyltransferase PlsY
VISVVPVLKFLLTAVAAYFIGNLNFSIILSHLLYRKDIRRFGSGNAGTTNTLRVFGILSGLLVLILDLGKGTLAAYVGLLLLPGESRVFVCLFAGLSAALGHVYPVLFRFRGGKGVATIMGTLLMLDWRIFLCAGAILLLTLLLSNYMSLASMVMACMLPVVVFLFCYLVYQLPLAATVGLTVFSLLYSGLVLFTHRANIQRLSSGSENKFFKKPSDKQR